MKYLAVARIYDDTVYIEYTKQCDTLEEAREFKRKEEAEDPYTFVSIYEAKRVV